MDKYIKRVGFTPAKALLAAAGALFIAATVANTALSMKGVDTGYGVKSGLTCIWLGMILCLAATVLGNYIRRGLWNNKGYKGTPVVALFWVNADGKTSKNKDIFLNFESMLPRELLEEICVQEGTIANSEVVTEVCAVEKSVSSFVSIILTVIAVVILFAGYPEFSASVIFAIALCAIFNRTRSKTYHGADVASKYYRQGLGVYYVLRQAAAMGIPLENLVEEFTDLELEYFQDGTFLYYSLINWQGIYMEKGLSANGKPDLAPAVISFCKKERMRYFGYREAAITRERLNLNDIYMCYVLIHGNDAQKQDLIKEYYDKLSVGDNARALALRQELDWRRDMVAGKPVDVNAHPLFRPVDFLQYFPSYQENEKTLKERVLEAAENAAPLEDAPAEETVAAETETVIESVAEAETNTFDGEAPTEDQN